MKKKKWKKYVYAGGGSSAFSQNMFFAGANSTMIPFTSDAAAAAAAAMGVSNAVRNPPTLWQYPSKYKRDLDYILIRLQHNFTLFNVNIWKMHTII